jgi:hypothetical protein
LNLNSFAQVELNYCHHRDGLRPGSITDVNESLRTATMQIRRTPGAGRTHPTRVGQGCASHERSVRAARAIGCAMLVLSRACGPLGMPNKKDVKDSSLLFHVRPSFLLDEDVRKFAAEQGVNEEQAIETGMERKAREFVESGGELYAKA